MNTVSKRSQHMTDIKPNNILIDRIGVGHNLTIRDVQLADIEESVHVPPGSNIRGAQVGNWMWRSPEAHAEGRINKPSDMFSYGIVVSETKTCLGLTFR